MPIYSRSPAYNLKVVLKETGLKADVLRAWERRYELPRPHRTPGGHRLYSEHDIETVKWLQARQAEGLSISRAVGLWSEVVESGRDPLVEYLPASPTPVRVPVLDTRIEILRREWLEACLSFDSLKADEILNQAFAVYPVETVCAEILRQGISDIGTAWYLDKATVQQEHFASALVSRRLETLLTATPQPTRRQTVLVGCPPGEQHILSGLLLSLLLRRRGLKVVYLGADIPVEQLAETAYTVQPDLIILAAQQLATAATLQSAALVLAAQGFSLAYGGLIFNRVPNLRERIPAHFLGETLDGAIQLVERIVVAPASSPTPISMDENWQALAQLYQAKRPLVEIVLLAELQKMRLQTRYIAEANFFFGNGLSAALELGDPAFMEADLEWIQRLLAGRKIPVESLGPYLAVYSQAIRKEMGAAGAPIADWMDACRTRVENCG